MSEVALLVVFPLLMAYAGASDLLTMTIPNRLSIALVATFAVMVLLGALSPEAALMHVAAGACVLAATFAMFALGWIGGGDAKLAAATALWLGFGVLPDYLFVASLAGGLLTLSVILLRRTPVPLFAERWTWLSRLQAKGSGVPYGIALAAAALVVLPYTEIWAGALAH